MKKIFIYPILIIGITLFNSCSKQKESNWEAQPYSKIYTDNSDLKDEYILEQWDTLSITSPEFKQTHQDKPISYEWQIGEDIVSREKDLKYVASNFGVFKGQFRAFNGQSYLIKNFTINVRYKYVEGLYALAHLDGKTVLSYLPEENSGKSFEQDILAKNNVENSLFASTPKTLFFSNDNTSLVYVATENPNAILRFDANLMILKSNIGTQSETISNLQNEKSYYSSSSTKMYAMVENRLAQFDYNKDFITNNLQQEFDKKFSNPQIQFCKDIVQFVDKSKGITTLVFFDNAGGRMLSCVMKSYMREYKEIYAGKFKNYEAVRVLPASQNNYLATIFKGKSDHKYYLFYGLPNPIETTNISTSEDESESENNTTSVLEIKNADSTSEYITAVKKDILYYSVGNKIYAYSVVSKGNFSENATFTLDSSSEVVTDMYINTDNSKLYIATHDASSGNSLKGSVYCFDIAGNNHSLIWKKKNITGKIIKLDYRYL